MENTQQGNVVSYEIPQKVREMSGPRILLASMVVLAIAIVIGLFQHVGAAHSHGFMMGAILSLVGLVGVNAVTYEWPVAGATAPTATQAKTHQILNATVLGDGAATTFTITHNWGLSAADLAAGFPLVEKEAILAAGITAAAFTASKSANAVVFTCTAFTGAGLRVTLQRPYSQIR